MTAFDRALELERTSEFGFRSNTPDSWRSRDGRPQGGLVAAQLMQAMIESVHDEHLHPRSITTQFLRSPGPGPYDISVTIERAGRTVTNLSARCIQDGKLQSIAIAVFGVDRDGQDFDELPMPKIAAPNGREREAFYPDFAYPFADHIVAQLRTGHEPFSQPDGPMHNAGWVGFTDARPFDAPGLLVLADAGMMPYWIRLDGMVTTATVDYTVHFRSDFPRSYPNELAVIENQTRLVRNGFLDWDITIWGPDGEVLSLARQQVITLAR